ncbi:hypothetical protein VTN96DRAFT_3680 [Rasamsonia emersonii]
MLQTSSQVPLFKARTTIPRPLSEATEILDTDFESEFEDEELGDSPRRSVGSLGADSVTTASTPRDVPTPDSAGLTAFNFHLDEKPVKGPVGPHLFRASVDSSDLKSSLEVDFVLAKTPTTATFFDSASKLEPERKDTPLPGYVADETPQTQTELKSINKEVSQLDEAEVRNWSPQDVVTWMQNAGFDDSIVEKFFINDISGAILLELQAEDLKELDIHSFGKRHRLMNSIQQLRNSVMSSSGDSQTPVPNAPNRDKSSVPQAAKTTTSSDDTSSNSEEERKESRSKKHHRRRRREHRHHRHDHEDIGPGDSASIVAIEQILPKIHRCSKGENCRKWQKQQRRLARLAKDLPIDTITGSTILTGDPGNPDTAPNLLHASKSEKPELSPSVVASSDVLGPGQTPNVRLCEEKLNEVQPRDPQENVRQFLNFQHLSRLQPVNDPATPPREMFPSPGSDSPDSVKTSASLAENLRHLPKLTIPNTQSSVTAANLSANVSAQRTVTPSILQKKPNFTQPSGHQGGEQAPFTYGQDMSPADFYRSPSDFYRSHELYRQETPFSEVDVPVTAIPAGPIPREVSQSVPPNMRFGHDYRAMADPITRPASTKAENHRRRPSLNVCNGQPLERVDEGQVAPIETPEDLQTTPRASSGPRTPNDIQHSGWMKKRKTTRLLRHEWEEHHFTLRGTQLAMYEDEQAARRDSKALEYIDVDDYAVACSSFASRSKLTAAFKKTVLKRKDTAQDEAAFAFSLIPTSNSNSSSIVDRKAFFLNNNKAHHFAVKTRDERIDWMRELMLAKALKRGKESGDAVKVNGNVI